MAIKIVTAKKGEPHITSADDGALHQGTFGMEDYVLNVGEKFRAELVSNNEIKIYDGEGMMQGRHWRIEPGTYESLTIDNGSQGKKRKDLIVARYTKDAGSGVENIELAVLKGSETEGNATAPESTKGDIRNGDLKHEMVLYTVTLDGLNVTAVDTGFSVLMTSEELTAIAKKTERNLPYRMINKEITPSFNNSNAFDVYAGSEVGGNVAFVGATVSNQTDDVTCIGCTRNKAGNWIGRLNKNVTGRVNIRCFAIIPA